MTAPVELDELFAVVAPADGPEQVRPRARQPFFLFGAGHLGRTILAGLRKVGVEPAAFADDTPSKQGLALDGVPVMRPEEAIRRFGPTGNWVVTILNPEHRYLDSRRRLHELGCANVCSFLELAHKYPDVFLPYYQFDVPSRILPNRRRIEEALPLFSDAESRRQFLAHLRFRLRLDYSALPPTSPAQYFTPGIVPTLPADIVFVDCGAYAGDTIGKFLALQAGAFRKVVAVEPDQANFARLREYVASLDGNLANRIELHRVALGDRRKSARFNGLGNMSAGLAATGADEIEVVPLDELLVRERPMYVKFDIEGGEFDALNGCRELLREVAPLLAVSVYHRPGDLWEIPLLIRTLNPHYQFVLSTEGEDGMDVVCYAVPPDVPCPRLVREGGSR